MRLPVLALLLATSAAPALAENLTLLSMNMWGAGANDSKTIDETVAVMKASGADIIAAIETVPKPDPCGAGIQNCQAGDASAPRTSRPRSAIIIMSSSTTPMCIGPMLSVPSRMIT